MNNTNYSCVVIEKMAGREGELLFEQRSQPFLVSLQKTLTYYYQLCSKLKQEFVNYIGGRPGGEDKVFGARPPIPKSLRTFWDKQQKFLNSTVGRGMKKLSGRFLAQHTEKQRVYRKLTGGLSEWYQTFSGGKQDNTSPPPVKFNAKPHSTEIIPVNTSIFKFQ